MSPAGFISGSRDFTQHLTSGELILIRFSWRVHLGVDCARACSEKPFRASLTCRYAIANQQVIRDAEESRSGQFRPFTCEIATSDPHVLNPCSHGVDHVCNFDQSQVKSHEGLACVRVCGFCKLVFSTKSIEYSLIRACFRKGPLIFCKLEYSSVRACFWRGRLALLQASVSQ